MVIGEEHGQMNGGLQGYNTRSALEELAALQSD